MFVTAVVSIGVFHADAQQFFPLKDVHPGLRGTGRTVFQGDRVEEFQVEILGVLENAAPKQSVVIARLSGGPLAEAGVIQGMSGSPVYIDGKLLGAVALGFPYSKEPIAGIQPIEQMIANDPLPQRQQALLPASTSLSASLAQILTPVTVTGFTPAALEAFAPKFRKLGFEPQQGVSGGSPSSPDFSGKPQTKVQAGSMISVQLLSGDMSVSAEGTVTYVDGNRLYAFGHRFLDVGSTELPFATADVLAVVPTLNASFKLATPKQWAGTILYDNGTGVAGELGRKAHTIPIHVLLRSHTTGTHEYHMEVVNDRMLTPFITQSALFSAIDATERTVGSASMRLNETIRFDDPGVPPLVLHDAFVSDSALPQTVSADAVVAMGFIMGAGYKNLHVKDMDFELETFEAKRQLYINQVWASAHQVRAGDTVEIMTLLAGEGGLEFTKTFSYKVPIGTPAGPLNFTVSDANTLNFPDFAGMNAASAPTAAELVSLINQYRGSQAAYLRVWRAAPAFTISGPLPGGEITDPPPSVMLILADPSTSPTSNLAQVATRGSQIAERSQSVDGYVVTGARTVQVDVAP